ncbi:hypothetical protein [Rhizobium leguminosarum]
MSMIERVGNALEAVQLFSRWNDWTSDRVEGMPIEICRHGGEDEDEIIVVKRFDASWKESDALRVTIKDTLARAAIEAMRTPTTSMEDAVAKDVDDWISEKIEDMMHLYKVAIDAALKEQEKSG